MITAAPPPANPAEAVLAISTGVWSAQALWAAACLGVADHLADGPRHPDDLAAATGTQPGPLRRLLRTLAGLGVFAEQPDGRFGNNAASETLRADVPGSVRDYVIYSGQPWHVGAYVELLHALRTGQPSVERVIGKPLWQFLADDAEAGRIFDAAMTGVIAGCAMALRASYDFAGVRRLVDVGGGHGTLLATVLAATPGLRGVLFDQPHVVGGAARTFEQAGVRDRVEIVGGDFFREVPGGDAYVLSHIVHDWDDARATAILRTIRRAADPGARLVLVETVIPPGNAPSFGKVLDVEMLAMAGGEERTEAEYAALLRAGGFRLVRCIGTGSFTDVIEAVAEPA